jgi:hypothetical protein
MSSPRLRNVLRSTTLAVAMASVAGCESTGDAISLAEHQQAVTTASPAFSARPSQRLLFTAKAKVPAATAEAFIRSRVFPLLARESRVGDISTYVDAKGTYFVELELRTTSRPQLSLALDVFSVGRTKDDAEALLAELARHFDVTASQLLVKRSDLSISRSVSYIKSGGGK